MTWIYSGKSFTSIWWTWICKGLLEILIHSKFISIREHPKIITGEGFWGEVQIFYSSEQAPRFLPKPPGGDAQILLMNIKRKSLPPHCDDFRMTSSPGNSIIFNKWFNLFLYLLCALLFALLEYHMTSDHTEYHILYSMLIQACAMKIKCFDSVYIIALPIFWDLRVLNKDRRIHTQQPSWAVMSPAYPLSRWWSAWLTLSPRG